MKLWGPFKKRIWVRCSYCSYRIQLSMATFLGPVKCPSCKLSKEFEVDEPRRT